MNGAAAWQVHVTPAITGGNTPSVDQVVVHPSFASNGGVPSVGTAMTDADLALLHLNAPIQVDRAGAGELPVTMWAPPIGTQLHCYGLGQTAIGGDAPQPLQDAFLNIAAYTTQDGTSYAIPEGFTLYANGMGQQLAEGDSGGPCFVRSGDPTKPGTLAGIDSTAATDPTYGTIQFVQQTGLMYFYGWLGSVMSAEIQDVVATFGGNLGAPAGNVTWAPQGFEPNSPAATCTGLSSCTDPATTTWLGDPYPGQAMTLSCRGNAGGGPGSTARTCRRRSPEGTSARAVRHKGSRAFRCSRRSTAPTAGSRRPTT